MSQGLRLEHKSGIPDISVQNWHWEALKSGIWTHKTDHYWLEVRCLFHSAIQIYVE